jgi:hypothetical protein
MFLHRIVFVASLVLLVVGAGTNSLMSDAGLDCQAVVQPNAKAVTAFLRNFCYRNLGWAHDVRVRPTGPVVDGIQFGVHGNVRIWYPPPVFDWLKRGRPEGTKLPDGTLVVKEQYDGLTAGDPGNLSGWTWMLRDASASHDGWLWGYTDLKNDDWNVAEHFLPYCINCHAGADNQALLFSSLGTITGNYVTHSNIDTALPNGAPPVAKPHGGVHVVRDLPQPRAAPDPDFLALFGQFGAADPSEILHLPPASKDRVVPPAGAAKHFVTSDVCSACHDANSELTYQLPDMMVIDEQGTHVNLSPYGEWSASVMGLSGRDPIFHAQLESEKALHPGLGETIDNVCYRCHGSMGQHQLQIDHGDKRKFSHDMIYATGDHPDAKYGALARDGISCGVCHRIAEKDLGQPETFTGQFNLGPADTIYGPFADPKTYAMDQATGASPEHAPWIKESRLCGTCHTVVLPVLDVDRKYDATSFAAAPKTHEQTTYLEWLNSKFQDAAEPVDETSVKRCQTCHMPQSYKGKPLAFRIANIQDSRYPYAENLADAEKVDLKPRQPFSRHTLLGINLFVMEMFQQFSQLLGVHTKDPNIAAREHPLPSLLLAEEQALELAREQTATVSIDKVTRNGGNLEVDVNVTNLAGHKFPSGVGFRRAFIELRVEDESGKLLWGSGVPSKLGVILDGAGEPLATEFSKREVQPHYERITAQDQAQIYETRHLNSAGELTTSFLALKTEVKDNRLLPAGWREGGPYAEITAPKGIDGDPAYEDGSGSDRIAYRIPRDAVSSAAKVRAILHYQTTPPYYLRDRFETAQGPATKRLHFIASHLATVGTPIDGWTLKIAEAKVDLD